MTKTMKKVIAGISALVIIAGVTVGGWAINKYAIKDNQFTITDHADDGDNGGMIVGESHGSGVSLMSTKIAPADYAEYGVSPLAETAYTLTATVEPDNATYKVVDWSVEFNDVSSAWATGKTVTDYVTVTPTSDGALTATVECLQAFGEQIYVVVASRDYADVTAKCTVDYKKRVVDADVKITKVGTGEVSAVDLTRTSTKYLFEAVPVLGVGTIETDIYYFAYMLPSSDLATFAKAHSVSIVRDDTEYNVSWCSDDDISSHFTVSTSSIFNLACSPRVPNTTFISRIFQNALVDYSGETLMTIKFNFFETSEQAHKYEDSGDAFSLGFVAVDIPVGMIDLVVSVTGVGLDNSSIIF